MFNLKYNCEKIKLIFIILFSILFSSHSSSDELSYLFLKLNNAENFSEAKISKKYGISGLQMDLTKK